MAPLLSETVRRRRFQAVVPHIRGDVLDLGCGHAGILAHLAPDQTYVGVEGHPEIFAWLQAHHPERRFFQRDLDSDRLDIPDRFDTVLMLAIVEHLRDPGHLLRQVPARLKDGGRAVITTPTPLGGRVHEIGARMGLLYREAVDEHERMYDLPALEPLLSACGLVVVEYRRFLFGLNQLLIGAAKPRDEEPRS